MARKRRSPGSFTLDELERMKADLDTARKQGRNIRLRGDRLPLGFHLDSELAAKRAQRAQAIRDEEMLRAIKEAGDFWGACYFG